jgi:hypothetical protein
MENVPQTQTPVSESTQRPPVQQGQGGDNR